MYGLFDQGVIATDYIVYLDHWGVWAAAATAHGLSADSIGHNLSPAQYEALFNAYQHPWHDDWSLQAALGDILEGGRISVDFASMYTSSCNRYHTRGCGGTMGETVHFSFDGFSGDMIFLAPWAFTGRSPCLANTVVHEGMHVITHTGIGEGWSEDDPIYSGFIHPWISNVAYRYSRSAPCGD